MITPKTLPEEEFFVGHKACGGCGASLVVRWTLKVLGPRALAVVPAGCMSAVGFIWPQMAFGTNAMIAPFAATASVLSGVAAAVRARGLTDAPVVGFAGDGATADIGLQALSGAWDRGDRMVYICYDNEAYMNTGIQKSGATPVGARTTTSPGGHRPVRGGGKKDLFAIARAHGIPYAATASVGYAADFLRKVEVAAAIDGPSFLHVLAPCPTGWGCATDSTIRLAKAAVDTGIWPLLEFRDGRTMVNRTPREFRPLSEYTAEQGRFRGLTEDELRAWEGARDRKWAELGRPEPGT